MPKAPISSRNLGGHGRRSVGERAPAGVALTLEAAFLYSPPRGGSPMAQGAPVTEAPVRRTIEVRSPATGVRLAAYPVADRETVAATVARAREAQGRWLALGFAERGRILRRVRDRLVDE